MVTVAGGALPPNPRALVVIPTYNERESIGHLLRDVCRAAAVDVLVVDDSSPDGTADTVEEVRASERRVHLLVRPRRLAASSAGAGTCTPGPFSDPPSTT